MYCTELWIYCRFQMCVSLFTFWFDKYLTSYALDTCRNACRSWCKMIVKIVYCKWKSKGLSNFFQIIVYQISWKSALQFISCFMHVVRWTVGLSELWCSIGLQTCLERMHGWTTDWIIHAWVTGSILYLQRCHKCSSLWESYIPPSYFWCPW
jgi:hypothetical protein